MSIFAAGTFSNSVSSKCSITRSGPATKITSESVIVESPIESNILKWNSISSPAEYAGSGVSNSYVWSSIFIISIVERSGSSTK